MLSGARGGSVYSSPTGQTKQQRKDQANQGYAKKSPQTEQTECIEVGPKQSIPVMSLSSSLEPLDAKTIQVSSPLHLALTDTAVRGRSESLV